MTCVPIRLTGRKHATICIDDYTPVVPGSDCPDADRHTPCPRGYVAMSEWADRMLRTHRQEQCPGCGRWHIWIKEEG